MHEPKKLLCPGIAHAHCAKMCESDNIIHITYLSLNFICLKVKPPVSTTLLQPEQKIDFFPPQIFTFCPDHLCLYTCLFVFGGLVFSVKG